jgi:hypothetical protein
VFCSTYDLLDWCLVSEAYSNQCFPKCPEASKPERQRGGPSPFLAPSSCALDAKAGHRLARNSCSFYFLNASSLFPQLSMLSPSRSIHRREREGRGMYTRVCAFKLFHKLAVSGFFFLEQGEGEAEYRCTKLSIQVCQSEVVREETGIYEGRIESKMCSKIDTEGAPE